MKKLAFLLFSTMLILTSCELESPNIEVEHVYLEKNTLSSGNYFINFYNIDVSYTNTGDFIAEDVSIDVHLYLTDGRIITHTYFVGNIEAHESETLSETQTFINAEIDDYFVEAFWSE